MRNQIAKLAACLSLSLILVLGLVQVLAGSTTGEPNYDIVLGGSAPNAGRSAPYGQLLITHNNVGNITTTVNYGMVARTAGYDWNKAIYCENTGSYTATLCLYGRTSSTGSLYNVQVPVGDVNPSSRVYYSVTNMAPWLTLGITSTSASTGTTMTCGIYVQTP